MKQKTNKLRKLEKSRMSALTNDLTKCYICKAKSSDIHEIYGGANRKMSMEYDFCIPLCRSCHYQVTLNAHLQRLLKINCQKEFEKTHTREEFLKIIGRSYVG